MYFILKLLIVCYYSFLMCQSAIILYPAVVHPAHPFSCWNDMSERPVSVGGEWQEPNCVHASCFLFKRRLFVERATCGRISVPSHCVAIEDFSMEYPHCCSQLHCGANADPQNFLGQDYEDFKEWLQNTYYDTTYS